YDFCPIWDIRSSGSHVINRGNQPGAPFRFTHTKEQSRPICSWGRRRFLSMKRRYQLLAGAGVLATAGIMFASSHREALTVLNEPWRDNTATYAWVQPGAHDKLYLIMNFNPLHEPGQGNQGFRACNGYRYEFHIGKGASLADRIVYRVEFTNKLTP